MTYFAVISEQGPGWDATRSMRDQDRWAEHATFMNGLSDEHFVLFGGPLRGGPTHRALLIVRSDNEFTVRARLAEDPWLPPGILRIMSVDLWELLLGDPLR